MSKTCIIIFILFISTAFNLFSGSNGTNSDYWESTTPEEQGIDSGKLQEMFDFIEKNNVPLKWILIQRHGKIVSEKYFNSNNRDSTHIVQSVVKSILSALVGIAIREKFITSLDQKIYDFFPEYFSKDTDPAKKEITLRHLLTMTAGFKYNEDLDSNFWYADGWINKLIKRPLTDKPGENFNYNTPLTQMMAAIITKTSRMSIKDFADKYLFKPMGINIKYWRKDKEGYYFAGSDLTARDMMKFGYLYLKGGKWNEKQLVPEEWVNESTKVHVSKTGIIPGQIEFQKFENEILNKLPNEGDKKFILDYFIPDESKKFYNLSEKTDIKTRQIISDKIWPMGFAKVYGFWWWIDGGGFYEAMGAGGQRITVIPNLDMVVVMATTGITPVSDKAHYLLTEYILRAVISD